MPPTTTGRARLRLAEPACRRALASVPSIRPSRIHLPAPLRSTGITPRHRYYGCSDSCPTGSSAPQVHEHRPCAGQVSLLHAHIRPDHSVSTHLALRRRGFITLPISSAALPPLPSLRQVKASPFGSRLAGRARPYRVRHPTDWSFTSCCSPPRLTATQLQSVTGRRTYARRGLAPLCMCALAGALPPSNSFEGAGLDKPSKTPSSTA